jgi:hypothetical protein
MATHINNKIIKIVVFDNPIFCKIPAKSICVGLLNGIIAFIIIFGVVLKINGSKKI